MKTLHEINLKAKAALRASLPPDEYVRFFQQYSNGSGDYTKERQEWPEEDARTVHERTMTAKDAGLLPPPPPNAKIIKV